MSMSTSVEGKLDKEAGRGKWKVPNSICPASRKHFAVVESDDNGHWWVHCSDPDCWSGPVCESYIDAVTFWDEHLVRR